MTDKEPINVPWNWLYGCGGEFITFGKFKCTAFEDNYTWWLWHKTYRTDSTGLKWKLIYVKKNLRLGPEAYNWRLLPIKSVRLEKGARNRPLELVCVFLPCLGIRNSFVIFIRDEVILLQCPTLTHLKGHVRGTVGMLSSLFIPCQNLLCSGWNSESKLPKGVHNDTVFFYPTPPLGHAFLISVMLWNMPRTWGQGNRQVHPDSFSAEGL